MRIDGSVKTNTRQALVNDFQNNRDLRAAVLSIQAAGTGLTLTVRPGSCSIRLSDIPQQNRARACCSADSVQSLRWRGLGNADIYLFMPSCHLQHAGAWIVKLQSAPGQLVS